MNLRALIYSNPLSVDKIGKSFQYWKDSGFIYTKHLVKNLPKGWRFYWCIPDKIKDVSWFTEANENVEIVPYPYSTSIHQNRYNFSVNTLSKYFSYGNDIDLIINNQPEVSANLRVWGYNQRRESPLIFSYYHWIDCEESQAFGADLSGYSTRQADGAKASDWLLFHNDYAYWMFMREANKVMSLDYTREFWDKYFSFTPPATVFDPLPFEGGYYDTKIILFNHRLNKTTNWKEVVKTLDEIYKDRQDFMLWVTDDGKMKEFEYLRERKYIKVQSLSDGEYGQILKQSHFSICNHEGYSTWNMAVIDSLINGCLALIPRREVYRTMFKEPIGKFGEEFTHSGDLKEQIIKLLDNTKEKNVELAKRVVDSCPWMSKFNDSNDLRIIAEGQVEYDAEKTPSKYEKVLEFIRERGSASKKEWANEFWSFHVNSNFPLIRKKLLMESDIVDDTSQSETVYKIR